MINTHRILTTQMQRGAVTRSERRSRIDELLLEIQLAEAKEMPPDSGTPRESKASRDARMRNQLQPLRSLGLLKAGATNRRPLTGKREPRISSCRHRPRSGHSRPSPGVAGAPADRPAYRQMRLDGARHRGGATDLAYVVDEAALAEGWPSGQRQLFAKPNRAFTEDHCPSSRLGKSALLSLAGHIASTFSHAYSPLFGPDSGANFRDQVQNPKQQTGCPGTPLRDALTFARGRSSDPRAK